MTGNTPRSLRVFISSTFRDFEEERRLLVNQVFPTLRRRAAERFVDIVEVDLRWGITARQAERGRVLPICLREIERCRPWFIAMLGERYGWTPGARVVPERLVASQPWLAEHLGGVSVTELEILHGVLNNPAMAGRAFFYFRSPAWAEARGAQFLAGSKREAAKLARLKNRILAGGFPVEIDVPDPAGIAALIERDLWRLIDALYPPDEVPDVTAREAQPHRIFANARMTLLVGRDDLLAALDRQLTQAQAHPVLALTGPSGVGKSALLAHAVERYRRQRPQDLIFEHYLSSGPDAADPVKLIMRLLRWIAEVTDDHEPLPMERRALHAALPQALATLSHRVLRNGAGALLVLDGLDRLTDDRDLAWLPTTLPPGLRLLLSTTEGDVQHRLDPRSIPQWTVPPLDPDARTVMVKRHLGRFLKALEAPLLRRIKDHRATANPQFLRVLLDELRLSANHDSLPRRVDECLAAEELSGLYAIVFARIEGLVGRRLFAQAMRGLYTGRKGLSEAELQTLLRIPPLRWAAIRLQIDDLLYEEAGLLRFGHDSVRLAVERRYLRTAGARKTAHGRMANFWADQWNSAAGDPRRIAGEWLWQLRGAGRLADLAQLLLGPQGPDLLLATSTDELLAHWLAIEAATAGGAGPNLNDCKAAWASWLPGLAASGRVAAAASALGALLGQAGRYSPFVEALSRSAVEALHAERGSDHPETIEARRSLGLLLIDRGRLPEAEVVLREATESGARALGEDDPRTLNCLSDLGWALLQARRLIDAEAVIPVVLARRLAVLPEDHPHVATSYNNLGALRRRQKRCPESEAAYRKALAIRSRLFGAGDSRTASTMNNLAIVLKEMSRFAEAEKLYLDAIEARRSTLGPHHPHVGESVSNLAALYRKWKRFEDAEAGYREALAIKGRHLPPGHPGLATTMYNQAYLWMKWGRLDEAETRFREVLAIREAALPPGHDHLAGTRRMLGELLFKQGRAAEAEPLLNLALQSREKNFGIGHRTTIETAHLLVDCLRRLGRQDEADALAARFPAAPPEDKCE